MIEEGKIMTFTHKAKRTRHGMLTPFALSSKHNRKYSDATISEMRDRRLMGETWRSIGKTYNVAGATIKSTIKRHNPIIAPNIPIPKGYITLAEYGDMHNLKYETVYYHLRAKNIHTTKRDNVLYIHKDVDFKNKKLISDEKIESIIKLWKEGKNKSEISRSINASRATVRVYLELFGEI
jgi:hypothetical protein